MTRLLLLWLACFALSPARAATPQVEIRVELGGVAIQAATLVNADARSVWNTLTDYNNLARFVPGMTYSRLVSPPGAAVKLLEQRGDGGLISLVIPDHVVFAIEEQPPARIRFRSVSGGLVSVQGEWVIVGEQAPVRLGYRAQIRSALPPPPLLTEDYVRREISVRMHALAREAEQRAARAPHVR
jgi:hypothetical protein